MSTTRAVSHLNSSLASKARTEGEEPLDLGLPGNKKTKGTMNEY